MSTVTVRAGGAAALTPDSTTTVSARAAAGAIGTTPFSTRQYPRKRRADFSSCGSVTVPRTGAASAGRDQATCAANSATVTERSITKALRTLVQLDEPSAGRK